jgi:hypothetical protein
MCHVITTLSPSPLYAPSCLHQVGSPPEAAATKQFLALADVVIYEMRGHEQATRDAVVHMNRQPVGGMVGMCEGAKWLTASGWVPITGTAVPGWGSSTADQLEL